jgi:hypothetical protein
MNREYGDLRVVLGLAAALVTPLTIAHAETVAVIAGQELALSPEKYVGERIEVRGARCFHAGGEEYRCAVPNRAQRLSILAKSIEPTGIRKHLQSTCRSAAESRSPRCRFTLRFVPDRIEFDRARRSQPRTIIRPAVLELTRPAGGS